MKSAAKRTRKGERGEAGRKQQEGRRKRENEREKKRMHVMKMKGKIEGGEKMKRGRRNYDKQGST